MKITSALLQLCLSSIITASFFDSQLVINGDDLSVPGDNPLSYCQDPKDDILTIEYVDLSPNPPKPGSVLTIEAAGNFSEKIEKGSYVDLTVNFGLIRLISTKEDLCDQLKNVDKECPIDKGRTVVKKEVEIPKQVPSGHYTVKADVFTPNGTKITCLSASITFKRE